MPNPMLFSDRKTCPVGDARATRRAGVVALATLFCAAALTGCGSPAGIRSAMQPIPADRLKLDSVSTSTAQLVELGPWWRELGDPQLSGVIEEALRDSPSVALAQARLQRAEAGRQLSGGAMQPQLQGRADGARQRYSEHSVYPYPLAGSVRNSGTLQLEGAWELDLFGRQRAELAAAVGEVRAAQADAQAARLLLSTQVARTHVQLARLQGQRDVAVRTLAQREETLRLIQQRVAAGLDTQVELRQGEASLPEVRQQIEALDEQIDHARHALAALSGRSPDALDAYTPSLGGLRHVASPAAMPVDLLARRADVMASLWRVEAAGQASQAARAGFYPNVDLRAFAGFGAIGLDRLINPGSFQWGLLPAVHLPIFDGDRREAALRGRVAEEDAAVARYNQTLLQAVQEVADTLRSEQSLQRQRAEQAQAQQASEAAYALARERYQAGMGNYLHVLIAETAVLTQRRLAVDLLARQLDNHVSLIHALGGSASSSLPVSQIPHPVSTTMPSSTGDRS